MAKDPIAEINRVFNQLVRENMPRTRQARYLYYTDKKGNRYFYTTKKIDHKGRLMYVSGVYRYYKTKKQYKLMKTVGHARRKKADARAYRLYKKANGE